MTDLQNSTDSPIRLVVALYDRALRHMEAGRFGIEHSDLELQSANLQQAQKAVMELLSCLNLDNGGELARNLISLYAYVLNELVEANVSSRIEPVDRCIRMMSFLRNTWTDVLNTASGNCELRTAA